MTDPLQRSITFSKRQVVLRHPESERCVLYRPVDLDAADEAFDYAEIGEGRCNLLDEYVPPAYELNGSEPGLPMWEAHIVSLAEPGTPEHFEPRDHDLCLLMLGLGVALTFEVVRDLNDIGGVNFKYAVTAVPELHQLSPLLE